MATAATHIFFSLLTGNMIFPRENRRQFWIFTALCALLPDADLLGVLGGIPRGHIFGHRGYTHSFFFALLAGFLIAFLFFRENGFAPRDWKRLWLWFFLVLSIHDLFDALNYGGRGVSFFFPFYTERYLLPWTPLKSITSQAGGLSFLGKEAMVSELKWVWLPTILLFLIVQGGRRVRSWKRPAAGPVDAPSGNRPSAREEGNSP